MYWSMVSIIYSQSCAMATDFRLHFRFQASLDANEPEVGSKLNQRVKLNVASLSFVLVCDSRSVFAQYTPLFAVRPCLSMTHTLSLTHTHIDSVANSQCVLRLMPRAHAIHTAGTSRTTEREMNREKQKGVKLFVTVSRSVGLLHQIQEKAKRTRLKQAPPTQASPQADYKVMSGLTVYLTRTCGCRPCSEWSIY